MKKALFVVEMNSQFNVLFQVAKLLKGTNKYNIFFYLNFAKLPPVISEEMVEICDKEGFEIVNINDRPKISSKTVSTDLNNERFLKEAALKVFTFLPYSLRSFIKSIREFGPVFRYFSEKKREIMGIINKNNPDIIILPDDSAETIFNFFTYAGRKKKIPSLIVPFTLANFHEPAEALYGKEMFSMKNPANYLAGSLFKNWVLEYNGKKMIRLPASYVLSMQLLGLNILYPWLIYGGLADKIAIESDAMQDYYRSAGLPEGKLALTGSIYCDIFTKVLGDLKNKKTEIYQKIGLNPETPFVLCAIPPDQFGVERKGCEFANYRELVVFFIKTLVDTNSANIVVNLHPRARIEDMKYIEELGAKVIQGCVDELIPLCDVYVASISATIRMAIACKKPVINYDVYKYGYSDYGNSPGVILVDNKEKYCETAKNVLSNSFYFKELVIKQADCAQKWGMQDGKSRERICLLVDELVERKN